MLGSTSSGKAGIKMEKTLNVHMKELRENISHEIEQIIAKEEDKQVESDDFIAGMEYVLSHVRQAN